MFEYPDTIYRSGFTYNPEFLMKNVRAREQDGEVLAAEEMEKPRLDGDPAVADRVENIVADIATGRATPMHRARIKGAIEKVEAPLTGRAKADAGLGRAIRFGGV